MGTTEEGMLEYNLKNNTEIAICSVSDLSGACEKGKIKFSNNIKEVKSGDNIEVEVEFENNIPMYMNEKLYFGDSKQNKAYGVLTIIEFN